MQKKNNDTRGVVAMTTGYAAGPVLVKTKIPSFYLKQRSSPPNNLIGRVKTIWEPRVFGARPSVAL